MNRCYGVSLVALLLQSGAVGCGQVEDSTRSSSSPPGDSDNAADNSEGSDSSGSGGSTASGGQSSGAGGSATGGESTGSGAAGAGGAPVESPVPDELFTHPSVWIGEVEVPVTYPALDGSDTSPERVVLILDAITNALTGSITFGEGPLPSPDPRDVYPTYESSDGTWQPIQAMNWTFSPFPGFPYSIVSSELRESRLALNYAPLELWAGFCMSNGDLGGAAGYCECSCDALDEPLRRLDLVVTGDTMEGQMTRPAGNWLGAVPAIRLQRVQ